MNNDAIGVWGTISELARKYRDSITVLGIDMYENKATYRINTVQENEKGDRLLFFSNDDIWPDDENFKQAYIIAKDFSERRIG